jgi:HEAT repeat protein
MLGIFLVASSVAYYIRNAPVQLRAAANVAAMAVFAIAFFAGLSYFEKSAPTTAATQLSAVDLLLKELTSDNETHRLEGIRHLGELHDPRIVPALSSVLSPGASDQVVEAAAEALSKQKDPRAVPALRKAAEVSVDHFLKLTIATAQLNLGDSQGFATLLHVLNEDEAGFARQQANELFERKSGQKFGYDAERSVAENAAALKRMRDWYARDAGKLGR